MQGNKTLLQLIQKKKSCWKFLVLSLRLNEERCKRLDSVLKTCFKDLFLLSQQFLMDREKDVFSFASVSAFRWGLKKFWLVHMSTQPASCRQFNIQHLITAALHWFSVFVLSFRSYIYAFKLCQSSKIPKISPMCAVCKQVGAVLNCFIRAVWRRKEEREAEGGRDRRYLWQKDEKHQHRTTCDLCPICRDPPCSAPILFDLFPPALL